MPIAFGVSGFELQLHERIAHLVAAAGGPTKAARLLGKTRTHIDNMRKPGAALRLEDLLPLCVAGGVSLDWVATGYQRRPDLDQGSGDGAEFMPLEAIGNGGVPEGFGVTATWLAGLGLTHATAAAGVAADDGMRPLIGRNALVILDRRPAQPMRSGIYGILVDHELLVRRLHRKPGGTSELVADADPAWRVALEADNSPPDLHPVAWYGQTP